MDGAATFPQGSSNGRVNNALSVHFNLENSGWSAATA